MERKWPLRFVFITKHYNENLKCQEKHYAVQLNKVNKQHCYEQQHNENANNNNCNTNSATIVAKIKYDKVCDANLII